MTDCSKAKLFWQCRGWRRYIGPKRAILTAVFLILLVIMWYLRQQGLLTPGAIFGYIHQHPVLAPLIFVAFYAFSSIFLVPTLPLNIGAGVFWGPIWGTFLALIGSGSGAVAAFLITRTAFGQPLARRFDNRILVWLQQELQDKSWQVVAFTRVNPIFPSGPLNYLFGLTSISTRTYIWSTLVFSYPLTQAFAMIGYSSGEIFLQGNTQKLLQLIMLISLALTMLLATRMVTRRLFAGRDAL